MRESEAVSPLSRAVQDKAERVFKTGFHCGGGGRIQTATSSSTQSENSDRVELVNEFNQEEEYNQTEGCFWVGFFKTDICKT